MKNNKYVKIILVLAALLIVCSLAVTVFAESGKNTAGEVSEVTTNKEESSGQTDDESIAAAETADANAEADESEEKAADAEAEEPAKHHKGRKPADPKSDSVKENKPAKDRDERHSRRSGNGELTECTSEDEKTGSYNKHSFGKDFDEDDDDDDEKDYGSKKSFSRGKRNPSEQQSEGHEKSSDKAHKYDRGADQKPSSKRNFPPASEKMKDEDKCKCRTQNERGTEKSEGSETGTATADITAAPETVTEDVPETETETPEGETGKDEA